MIGAPCLIAASTMPWLNIASVWLIFCLSQLRAARIGALLVSYDPQQDAVRLTRRQAGAPHGVDVRLAFAQVERNVTLGPQAFTVEIPASAMPVSLETLRESGLLGR